MAEQILRLSFSAERCWRKFQEVRPALLTYRDASYGPCSYKCTLNHCFRGLETALSAGIFSLKSFDLKAYEHLEKVHNGDFNWVIPGRIAAFSTPNQARRAPGSVS